MLIHLTSGKSFISSLIILPSLTGKLSLSYNVQLIAYSKHSVSLHSVSYSIYFQAEFNQTLALEGKPLQRQNAYKLENDYGFAM